MEGAAITETEVTVRKVRGGSIGSEKEMLDGASSSGSGSSGKGEDKGAFEYFGWIYHLGTNSIGHDYCHLRFLFIRGKYVEMFKRDPHENPGIKPIRRGIVGPTLMVEELGRRKVNHGDVYVIRFYSRLDETKKGEIACATAGEARKWMEAFDHAKQQVGGNSMCIVNDTSVLLVESLVLHLIPILMRLLRFSAFLKSMICVFEGPETLLRQASNLVSNSKSDGFFEAESEDVIDIHQWRCVRTINGVRIFEDVSSAKSDKGTLVKAVGVVDASADTVFEVFLNLDQQQRYEWDTLTGDLELLDSYDGHYDVLYGTYDPKYLTRWKSNRDFVFSRQWFRGQDGTYTILLFPAVHKKRLPRSGYRRTKIIPSSWEIRNLSPSTGSNTARCLVSQMLEMNQVGWCRWKQNRRSDFEKTTPYAMLTQVAGLKEYIGASPALRVESSTTVVRSKSSMGSIDFDAAEVNDEFYDATDGESSSDEEEGDSDGSRAKKDGRVKLKNVSWAIAGLSLKKTSAPDANDTLDPNVPPISIEANEFNGSLHKGKDEKDSNCWTSPNGSGFKIRGRTYLKDNSKVVGGDPLLELIAVDWFKVDRAVDGVAQHPECLLQTAAGKKLPFVLVINLQIPAKPNYSLVLYYAADRPVNKESLLGKFIDGTDMFRDSRFKLIPSIVEGYWMVKRAVGTKACLLGKAVTCKYLRQDNFLEIDVDIGSSSVARSVIGLVLGYVTSLVVDLAILVEGKEESELPEFILGTVRLNKLKLETAVTLEV
ncbi:Protein ENHANCED DISEASE RESISTANCE 2 [Linum grandiflorum]